MNKSMEVEQGGRIAAHRYPSQQRDGVEELLAMRGITKIFGDAKALDQVDFDLRPGEVHALIGMNGAGKSTLIGVLSGNHRPDAGAIIIDGQKLDGLDPRKARELGIATVPQRRDLVLQLSVAENLLMGDLPTRAGVVDWKAVRQVARTALAEIGIQIDVDAITGTLSAAEQTMVEIAREVHRGGRVLILDEPTAALGGHAAVEVRALVKRLRAQGKTVVYISHHLEEILELADRITVLRDAKWQLTVENAQLEMAQLIYAMVGDHVVSDRPAIEREAGEGKLELSGICVGHRLKDLGFVARAGQVTAVLGPAGDGQSLLFEVLSGRLKPDAGTLHVNGALVRPGSITASLRSGLRCIAGNRLGYGLVGGLSIDENILMAKDRTERRKLVNWRELHARAAQLRQRFGVVSIGANPPVGSLSGGNQQKVLLAKLRCGRQADCRPSRGGYRWPEPGRRAATLQSAAFFPPTHAAPGRSHWKNRCAACAAPSWPMS